MRKVVGRAEPDLISALCKHAFPLHCREDRELFHQGYDPIGLFILKSGEAILQLVDANGVLVARASVPPGSLLGLPALVADTPYSLSAIAKAGAQVAVVTRNTFSALMLSEPLLAMMILRVLAAEVRSTRVAISGLPARPRRARTLKRKPRGPEALLPLVRSLRLASPIRRGEQSSRLSTVIGDEG